MSDEILEIANFDEVAEVLLGRPRAMSHLLVFALLLTLATACAWAGLSSFDLTVKAPGTVRPSEEVAPADAQAGGTVREVLVQEGDTVPAGAVLMRIDLAGERSESERLATNTATLAARQESLAHSRGTLLEQHALDGNARGEAIRQAEEKVGVEEQRARVREDKARSETRFAALEVAHARTTEELKKKMFDAQIGSREDWNQAVRARELAEEKLAQSKREEGAIDRADVTLAQHEVERLKATAEAQAMAARREIEKLDAEAAQLAGQLDEQRQKLKALQAELAKADIAAPCAGAVIALAVRRPGEMVRPGQEVAKIVPRGARMRIEALVANADIAFLKIGMPARFRFQAYPYQKYGTLGGTIRWIAPDTESVELPGGGHAMAYKVKLDLAETEFRLGSAVGRVELGMLADVDVVTGSENVLALLWRKLKERFAP